MNKEKYEKATIHTNYLLLDGAISNCSACIIPESSSNDILIKDYESTTETEDLYF